MQGASSKARALRDFLDAAGPVAVLTGAGVSTASGIPDYRDRNGDWKHVQPMQFHEFAGSDAARRRYWARSYVGWQRFGKAEPNAAHHALARLESAGRVDTLITQNVDRLHSRAGSRRVIDLHGDLGIVVCLGCGRRAARRAFQARLRESNPDWHARVFRYRPDGDAELAEESHLDFSVPGCRSCAGVIKPDVVMFGESVPRERVAEATAAVERSDALLVIGSSLMVYSGFRFAKRAAELGKPIAIVNRGRTRADALADVRIDADCREVLEGIGRLPAVRTGPRRHPRPNCEL
jgi:NAD-dependent SIR2 family protein deacetylase